MSRKGLPFRSIFASLKRQFVRDTLVAFLYAVWNTTIAFAVTLN